MTLPVSAYREFISPPKEATETCNARVWINQEEKYCDKPVEEKRRCALHDITGRRAAYRKASMIPDDIRWAMARELEERSADLAKNRRNITELDDEIIKLGALIDMIEAMDPLGAVEDIRKLKETKASLILTRVNIEIKLHQILNTGMVWEKLRELFEKHVVDANARLAVEHDFADWLDSLVAKDEASKA
jgi:hypothetical protein